MKPRTGCFSLTLSLAQLPPEAGARLGPSAVFRMLLAPAFSSTQPLPTSCSRPTQTFLHLAHLPELGRLLGSASAAADWHDAHRMSSHQAPVNRWRRPRD